jgi:diacylglycerol O-acyltransferase
MSSVDAAWFRIDRPENAADVVALLAFRDAPPPARVRRLLEEKLLACVRFRQRVVRGSLAGGDCWELDPAFSLDRHLVTHSLDARDPGALQELVGEVATAPLEPGRPLWRIHLVGGSEGGGALVAKFSHCLGDGFALVGLLLSLADEREDGAKPRHVLPAARRLAPWLEPRATLLDALARPRRALALCGETAALAASLARMAALPADPPTLLSRPLSGRRRAAWSRGLPLERVRSAARGLGGTVNDVLVAAVAGALRRQLSQAGEPVDALKVRALMPVNLRPGLPPAGSGSLGNHFGLVFLELPVDAGSPAARFDAVRVRTAALKDRPDAVTTLGVLAGLGRLPALEPWAARFFTRKASLVITNVPGPRAPLHLAGSRIDHAMFWVPHPSTLGLGVSVLSYAGEVRIGVRADAAVLPRPGDLVDAFEIELEALCADAAPDIRDRAQGGPSADRRLR